MRPWYPWWHIVVRTWPDWRSLRVAVPWLYGVTLGLVGTPRRGRPEMDPSCWRTARPARCSSSATRRWPPACCGSPSPSSRVPRWWWRDAGSRRQARTARRQHLPVLLPAAVFGGALAVEGALVLGGSVETPLDRRFVVVHLAVAGALAGIGVEACLVVMRSRRARRRRKADPQPRAGEGPARGGPAQQGDRRSHRAGDLPGAQPRRLGGLRRTPRSAHGAGLAGGGSVTRTATSPSSVTIPTPQPISTSQPPWDRPHAWPSRTRACRRSSAAARPARLPATDRRRG